MKKYCQQFLYIFCHFRREFVAYSIQITCGNSWSFGNCFCLYSRSSSFWRTYIHYSKTISIDNRKWGSRNNTYWLHFFFVSVQGQLQCLEFVGFFLCFMRICQFGCGYPTFYSPTIIAGKKSFPSNVRIVAPWHVREEFS